MQCSFCFLCVRSWLAQQGLHYTAFELTEAAATDTGVSVTVQNSGSVASAVAVLVYLTPPASAAGTGAPQRFLAAYEKVWLEPGQAKPTLSLAYYESALELALADGSKALAAGEWTAEVSVGGSEEGKPAVAKFVAHKKGSGDM